MAAIPAAQTFDIARRITVVRSRNHQFRAWKGWRNLFLERLNEHFTTLVGTPFAEGQNAIVGIAAQREVRKFWSRGKDSVGAVVDVLAAIFFRQRSTICRQEH